MAGLLHGLNREQRRAVTHGDGPQLVLAGPGTGKTEVITRRLAWLIATKRALPREILALTFTDKAAFEMQARVDVLVPYGQADAAIHTFHAFGDRLLREHAFELGLAGDVRLIRRAEAILLLREHLFALGLDRYRPLGDPTRFLGALADLFSRAKDEGVEPAAYRAFAEGLAVRASAASDPADRAALADLAATQSELGAAYERYQALLAERGLIDHGDQVALCLRLLRTRPAVRQEVQHRYRHMLVDEFQDTSPTQLELVFALAGEARNVTVVGDDDQAIYTFRGAAASNMRRFAAHHAGLRRVVLRRNYRSRRPILDAAQRLIAHNDHVRLAALDGLDKRLIAQRRWRPQLPVRLLTFRTAEEEADGVAAEIARRVSAGARPQDFAVLVRTNGESAAFVRSLRVRGVPAAASARDDFYARPAIRPLVALLRVVADPSDTLELYALATAEPYRLGGADLTVLLHMARRGHRTLWDVLLESLDRPGPANIGAESRKAVDRLVGDVRAGVEMAHQHSTGEVLYAHLKRTGWLARLAAGEESDEYAADVVRFFEAVRSGGRLLAEDRPAFLVPHLAMLGAAGDRPAEAGSDDEPAVAVLTVHRAKGLEFPVVFLTGLAEGRFPLRGRQATLALPSDLCAPREGSVVEEALEEERRLCYVAVTRARDELFLSYATEMASGRSRRRPSPFIAEVLDLPAGVPDDNAQPGAPPRIQPPAAPNAPLPRSAQIDGPPRGAMSLSFSQLDEYIGCPERYRLRHVVGVPTPAHHALSYGSALHGAVAAFHLRQAQGQLMSEAELLAAFAGHWSAEGFLSREHEEARFAAGQVALRRFREAELAAATGPPKAVERPFSFRLGQDEIRGRIDRLDDSMAGAVITDYKSSDVRDQRKADQRARDSLQLQVYALAHEAETGGLPERVQLHFLDSGVVGSATPNMARLERARQQIGQAADGIRGGRFEAKPNPIGCGYCPYRDICPKSAA